MDRPDTTTEAPPPSPTTSDTPPTTAVTSDIPTPPTSDIPTVVPTVDPPTTTDAEPPVTTPYVPPETTNPPVPPETTNPPVPPETTIPPVPPETTTPYEPPRTTIPPLPPVTTPDVLPSTTDPYVTPTSTTRYVPPPDITTTTTRGRPRTDTTASPPITTTYSSTGRHSSSQSHTTTATITSLTPIPSPDPNESDEGMSTGSIVGIAVGSLAALILVLGLLFFWYRRRKSRRGKMSFNPIVPGMQERPPGTGGSGNAGVGMTATAAAMAGGNSGGVTGAYSGRESVEPLGNGYHQSGISSRTDTTHTASGMAAAAALAAGGAAGALAANGYHHEGDVSGTPQSPPPCVGDVEQGAAGYYQDGAYGMAMNDPHGVHYQPPVEGECYGQDQYDPAYATRFHQQQQQLLDEAAYAQQQAHPQAYSTDAYYGGMYDETAATAGYGYDQYAQADGYHYPAEFYGDQGYHHGNYAQATYYDPSAHSPSVAASSTPSSTRVLQPPATASSSGPVTPTGAVQDYAYAESDARWAKNTMSPPSTSGAGTGANVAATAGALAGASGAAIAASALHQQRLQQDGSLHSSPSMEARLAESGSVGTAVVGAGTEALAAGTSDNLSLSPSQATLLGAAGTRSSYNSVKSGGSNGMTRSPQTMNPQGGSDVEEDFQHLQSLRGTTDWTRRNPQVIIPKEPQQGATGEDFSGPSTVVDDQDTSLKVPVASSQ
ncbi:hypothetical protein DFQ27_002436 [Actinomortierella ambigua]|uniref:Uncharacterized protein n=1 Tax=Actinomortierella ambigua TaxID=1343610 RepID=A0A9P6U7E2_9FUNG|nr:hypothetical protein DFQ27_002436 [Actinomortierella ambigua]